MCHRGWGGELQGEYSNNIQMVSSKFKYQFGLNIFKSIFPLYIDFAQACASFSARGFLSLTL